MLDRTVVARTVQGAGAVLSALGAPQFRPGTTISQGARNIVEAMEAGGVRRLVMISASGAGDTRNDLSVKVRLGLPLVRKWMKEMEVQEEIVRGSALDWTLVRSGQLTDGPGGNQWVTDLRTQGGARGTADRADLAAFMLRVLEQDRWIRESPVFFSVRV